jgi:hypothetical protein
MTFDARNQRLDRAAFAFVLAALLSVALGGLHGRADAEARNESVALSTWSSSRLSATTPTRTLRADDCAESYGEFWLWPDYWDPGLQCLLELSAWDEAYIINGIQGFEGPCPGEANFLYGTNLREWTGNYAEAYEWEAFINTAVGVVGMHWTSFHDWALWAHEGAHGEGIWDEDLAWIRAHDCTFHIYG